MKNEKDLPDNVAPNPHSLPYASNIGAPVIRPDHSIGGWKQGAIHSANKHYQERFDKLKKEFEELAEDFKWNEIIFNSAHKFKPVIGKPYYLYKKDDGTFYLTLFAPHEKIGGDQGYQGTFKLNYDNRWEMINE
ncbi:MAG: DUF2452 domain-containing protein [Flavobacteriia bacterium]|nr:DUF2452 domain-containing protein [Flavobacteriia bacterium]